MQVQLICPSWFQIRSIADAQYFCEKILKGEISVPDADDLTLYHRLMKDGDRVMLGSAHYGSDPLTAEIPCCDDADIVRRVFHIRRSINKYLKKRLKE